MWQASVRPPCVGIYMPLNGFPTGSPVHWRAAYQDNPVWKARAGRQNKQRPSIEIPRMETAIVWPSALPGSRPSQLFRTAEPAALACARDRTFAAGLWRDAVAVF
jgi:hypothetical protein